MSKLQAPSGQPLRGVGLAASSVAQAAAWRSEPEDVPDADTLLSQSLVQQIML